jgi:hypothetical protein
VNSRWRGENWFNHDRADKISKYTDPFGGRGIRKGKIDLLIHALEYHIPWIFIGEGTDSCGPLLDVYWSKFNIVPRRCRERCWKVVVKLQTVHELYQFSKLMGQVHVLDGYHGKCGVDGRWYTPTRYSGFFYNKSREEGQACYERIRELMEADEYYTTMFMHEQTTGQEAILLKKGCTEMQHSHFGGFRSSNWEVHELIDRWNELEDRLNEMFNRDELDQTGPQPDWLVNKIIYLWCEYAHQIGDPTYRDVLGHDPFEYSEDTYHVKKGGDTEEDVLTDENLTQNPDNLEVD